MTAELIITNARVLTMDPARPRAEAVALAGGRIRAVGARGAIEAMAGPRTEVIDAGGRTLLPGFVESHMHLALGGVELAHLQLAGVEGFAAVRDAFRAFAARHPDRPVLLAQGAHYAILGRPISRAALDEILPDRPIAIVAHDHHTVWANTAALRAAGILHGASTPPGHEVVMGPDGLASGELREFEAFTPILQLAGEARLHLGLATGEEPRPAPDAAARAADRAAILAGLRHCAAQGITSIVNMDGNRYLLELLREMQTRGELLARVRVPFHLKPQMELDAALVRAEAMARDFDDDWLSSGFVKMFMDGVIDSGTAFMLNDYPDAPGHRGQPLFDPDRFARIATEIDRRGLQIAVHAIGDGAVRVTLDGYEAARRANGPRDSRHRIEHIELIDPADIPRLGRLGVTASLQPPHPPGAMDFPLQPTMDRIGRARWRDAYLVRSLAEAGARLAFASDWPVADVSVMRGLKAALTRQPYPGARDERLDLMAALRAYTADGAWAAHRDHLTGMLRPGLAGDLVLLGCEIEHTPPGELDRHPVALTVCGGRVTHRAAGVV
ncbi:MAG: amidohydrolase [Alphaproteobacteria bacterium]|nr:MAG: amidohydrolase [Alphaproteobacteria bacterium]